MCSCFLVQYHIHLKARPKQKIVLSYNCLHILRECVKFNSGIPPSFGEYIGQNYANSCGETIPVSGNSFGRVFDFHMTISNLGKGVIILVLTIAKQRSSRCIFSSRLAHSQFHASPWQCYILPKPWRQIFSQNKLTKMKHSSLNGDLYHMFWEHQ